MIFSGVASPYKGIEVPGSNPGFVKALSDATEYCKRCCGEHRAR
jgi:hypothetical protein